MASPPPAPLPTREGEPERGALAENEPYISPSLAPPSPVGKGARGLGRVSYRLSQGFRTLLSPLLPLDQPARDAALTILPNRAAAAFRALPKSDQRHALRVYRAFTSHGESDNDLLAAALLHDIGKHPGVGLTQRTTQVLLARWPQRLASLATMRGLPRRWRRGLVRLLNHAATGADLAASWGCTPATVAIIRASHDANASAVVRRLQAIDDES